MTVLQLNCHIPKLLNSSSSIPQVKPQIRSPICYSRFPSSAKSRNRSVLLRRRSNFRDGVDPVQESDFFNENGIVEDMDGYLNYLSLEYDSVWDTKPSWCQPWTIALTGVGIILGSWLVLNSIGVTLVVATVICLWWYAFLYSYPKAYLEMIAERRRKVTSGREDTYGMETGQWPQ